MNRVNLKGRCREGRARLRARAGVTRGGVRTGTDESKKAGAWGGMAGC